MFLSRQRHSQVSYCEIRRLYNRFVVLPVIHCLVSSSCSKASLQESVDSNWSILFEYNSILISQSYTFLSEGRHITLETSLLARVISKERKIIFVVA